MRQARRKRRSRSDTCGATLMKTAKRDSIAIALQAGIPVLIMGEPGIGKSRWVEGLGNQLGVSVETLIGATLLPEDIGGILAPNGEYILPGWFRRLQAAGRGILFLDELTCAAPSVQAALLRLVADKALQGEKLPPGVCIIASANPADQAAGGWDLAAPLANRFCHLAWEPDPVEWSREFVNGFAGIKSAILPDNWTDKLLEAKAMVSAYIRKNPVELQKFPKAIDQQSGPWPSARTWDYTATVLAAHKAVGADDTAAVVGLVGEGTGLQFLSWRNEMSLPDPEAVLANPELLPKREDQAFVTLIAVASSAVSQGELKTWQRAWAVLGVAAQRGLTDVAAPAAMLLADEKNKPAKAPAPKEAAAFLPLWIASGNVSINGGAHAPLGNSAGQIAKESVQSRREDRRGLHGLEHAGQSPPGHDTVRIRVSTQANKAEQTAIGGIELPSLDVAQKQQSRRGIRI
jgi:hypothetical protein